MKTFFFPLSKIFLSLIDNRLQKDMAKNAKVSAHFFGASMVISDTWCDLRMVILNVVLTTDHLDDIAGRTRGKPKSNKTKLTKKIENQPDLHCLWALKSQKWNLQVKTYFLDRDRSVSYAFNIL